MKRLTNLVTVAAIALNLTACASGTEPLGEDRGERECDSAGVLEQRLEALGDATKPTKFVVLVWDGSSNGGNVLDAFTAAVNTVSGWSGYKGRYIGGTSSLSTGLTKLDSAIADFGGVRKSDLSALVVGKSLGGAKTYKLLADNADYFNGFYRTAVAIVDAHEPGAPADAGRCDYWYDYVRFRCNSSDWNGNYDLAWRSSWDSIANSGRLKFFNVYQRDDNIAGYSFTLARGLNQYARGEDHFSIANSTYSRSALEEALRFLLQ
jgi:hypothetical protein